MNSLAGGILVLFLLLSVSVSDSIMVPPLPVYLGYTPMGPPAWTLHPRIEMSIGRDAVIFVSSHYQLVVSTLAGYVSDGKTSPAYMLVVAYTNKIVDNPNISGMDSYFGGSKIHEAILGRVIAIGDMDDINRDIKMIMATDTKIPTDGANWSGSERVSTNTGSWLFIEVSDSIFINEEEDDGDDDDF